MTGLNKVDEKLSFLLRMREHYDVELRKLEGSGFLDWDFYGLSYPCGTYLCAFGSMAESTDFPEITGRWCGAIYSKDESLADVYGALFGEFKLSPSEIEVRLGCPVESLFGDSGHGGIDDRIAVMDKAIAKLTNGGEQE